MLFEIPILTIMSDIFILNKFWYIGKVSRFNVICSNRLSKNFTYFYLKRMSHETQAFWPYICNTSSQLLLEIPRYLWGLIKSGKWDENSRTCRSRAGWTHRVCNAEKRKKGSGMQFAAVGRDARAERRQSDTRGVFSHKGGAYK